MSNFKIGDEIIKNSGMCIIGKIINIENGINHIILPGAGNMIMYLDDSEIEKHESKSKGTYYSMIIKEKNYWSNIKKNDVYQNLMVLREEYTKETYILNKPNLLYGLVCSKYKKIIFNQFSKAKYLNHYIDDENIVWIKLYFSDEQVVGWIQSYKVMFRYRILSDLINYSTRIKY